MNLPAKATPFTGFINEASAKYGVPAELIAAHIEQESGWIPSAFRYEPALNDGSYGLMQVLSKTASQVLGRVLGASELYDPRTNITAGTAYIAQNLRRWPDIKDAIAAYNAGTARKNVFGIYVNSKGLPTVQYYVDRVYNKYLGFSGQGIEYATATNITAVTLAVMLLGGILLLMPSGRKRTKTGFKTLLAFGG